MYVCPSTLENKNVGLRKVAIPFRSEAKPLQEKFGAKLTLYNMFGATPES